MRARAAAQLLRQIRSHGAPPIPHLGWCTPRTISEGYIIQSHLCERPLASTIVGYKIANTNRTSQAFLGLPKPFYGPLLSSMVFAHTPSTKTRPLEVKVSKFNLGLIEPEFAFLVGRDLKVKAVAPAIEIVHSSFVDWKRVGAPSLIADLACNGTWVRGEAIPVGRDLGMVKLYVDGVLVGEGGADRTKPWKQFQKLKERIRLRPGYWVTTGVAVDPPYRYCKPGERIVAEFSHGLGSVALNCV